MKTTYTKTTTYFVISTLLLIILSAVSMADLQLDNIQFDPAIIASGDEVDIVIQYHDSGTSKMDKAGNRDYTFDVRIEPDDTLTKEYVTIQDAEGDDVQGFIFKGEYYNKRFRVKVNNNAPAGNYEFKLTGQWYYKGVIEGSSQYLRFKMPVKKEGIVIDIATLETIPSEVRPGDNYVKIEAQVENTGQKDAKAVEINLLLPDGLKSSYTNNNRIWVGLVNAGESKKMTFFVDLDEHAEPKSYTLQAHFSYMDLDDNIYQKTVSIPFLVKTRPYLEVVSFEGKGRAGSQGTLRIILKNTGTESAEAVDVRILKQSSQPFSFDVRSDYIGELEPGEEGTAIFPIDVTRDAAIKDHDFKVLIRAKGDSDEGDDTIYTFNRRATFTVSGVAPNKLLWAGIIGVILIGIVIILNIRRKKK